MNLMKILFKICDVLYQFINETLCNYERLWTVAAMKRIQSSTCKYPKNTTKTTTTRQHINNR